jgi:hypothetical protein
MNKHRLACEKEGNFVEADMAKARLFELKDEQFGRFEKETVDFHQSKIDDQV